MRKKLLKILIFILLGSRVFSNVIDEKFGSSTRLISFPFILLAHPFVISSGTEYQKIDSLTENDEIKVILEKQGIKNTNSLQIDETQFGIFISKKDKILLFITDNENNLKLFGKIKRERYEFN